MNKKTKQPIIPHEHELILAVQSILRKTGRILIMADVMGDYRAARRASPQALQEFLNERMELNRNEAENAPPTKPILSKPTPSPEAASSPLELTETMRFMQKIAQDGVLLCLDRNKQLMAYGWRSVVEKWAPTIMTDRGAIRQTLLQISSTHGDTDPLQLREIADEVNFYRTCDRLRELQDKHGFVKAVSLHAEEEKANMVYTTFPLELDRS